jgi:hypothetical protein
MKYRLLLLAAALALAATACTGTDAVDTEERPVQLTDGRVVTCIISDGYNSGGISCDWDAPEEARS